MITQKTSGIHNSRFYRSLFLSKASAGCVAAISSFLSLNPLMAQPPAQSLTVPYVAVDGPDYYTEEAKADDFREPFDTPSIDSQPYVGGAELLPHQVYHQPAGALTGKTVFAMAGHGWTYNSDTMHYYTQRGRSHGMIEDLGNADQMHIFAHMVWNAGGTVIPFRPVDYQPNERVIDNTMPQVEFFGNWREGTSDRYYGSERDLVPYAVTSATLQETAVARYRPHIPESGYYPVYVWARDGADRSNQLYRIHHAGGVVESRVNWRRVGKTWAWLGTWYFNEGSDGFVEISNKVLDPYEAYNGHVVIADAVRFGNGMGDVPRPGGISGFSREDEGDCYWIERALGVNANRQIFDVGQDGSSTVSSPPKAAAHTNRETEGSFFDRVLISFHSNAATGRARGALALYNTRPGQRPSYQEHLAYHLGKEMNDHVTSEHPLEGLEWFDRKANTYNGVDFGELRRDYLQNEMAATIVENAFHDNAEDVSFLLNPKVRIQMAQSTVKGLLKWFAEISHQNSAIEMPPASPVGLVATQTKEAKIRLKWELGETGEYKGSDAEVIRIYRSLDGYSYDGGLETQSTGTELLVDPLTTKGVTFIRITATNSSGESLPSPSIAVGLTGEQAGDPSNMLVPVTRILDRTSNVPYKLGRQVGGPYSQAMYTERVRSIYNVWEPSGVAEALALVANGEAFDGATSNMAEGNEVNFQNYKRILITAEDQSTTQPFLTNKAVEKLRTYVNRGGKLYLAGAHLAQNMTSTGGTQKRFVETVMGIQSQATIEAPYALRSQDDRFYSTTQTVELNPAGQAFWNQERSTPPFGFKIHSSRSLQLMNFDGVTNERNTAALLTRPFYSEGEVITLGFALKQLDSPDTQVALMAAILKQL